MRVPSPIAVRPATATCESSSTPLAELDLGADVAERTDPDRLGEPRAGLDDGRGMNFRHRAGSIVHDHGGEGRFGHELVLDHRLALEFPDIAAVALAHDVDRELSPGNTGRRKRALSMLMK